MPLGEECDFCRRWLDDDEELRPLYVGDPPEPEPQSTRGFAETDERVAGFRDGDGETRVLGYSVGEIAAILDAIEKNPDVAIEVKGAVQRVKGIGGGVEAMVEATVDTGRVGAKLTVEPPELTTPEPDLELCRFCYESMSEGSDDE